VKYFTLSDKILRRGLADRIEARITASLVPFARRRANPRAFASKIYPRCELGHSLAVPLSTTIAFSGALWR
jgi:hypothetical protein